jgi:hypothetical protein
MKTTSTNELIVQDIGSIRQQHLKQFPQFMFGLETHTPAGRLPKKLDFWVFHSKDMRDCVIGLKVMQERGAESVGKTREAGRMNNKDNC